MIRHIIRREFKTLSKSKSMRISTAVIVILILVAGVVARFVMSDDGDQEEGAQPPTALTIAVEEQMADYAAHLEATGQGVVVIENIGEAEAESFLRERDEAEVDGPAVVLAGDPGEPLIVAPSDGVSGADRVLTHLVNTAATAWFMESEGLQLDDADYAALSSTIAVPVETISFGGANLIMTNPVGYFTSLAGIFVMFMMIMMGITTIANGVLEEKSSRVVEIILTTVRPRTLLLGKVLGIGLFLLVQFALYVLAIVAALNIAGVWMSLNLGPYIASMLVWLLLGFFFYVTLTGALASTASRQEDLGAVTTPISFGMLVPFYVGFILVPMAPESLATKIVSMIPGFSPFVMPVRQAYDAVTTVELAIAAVLALLAIPLVARLAGKIYENSILHTGKKLKISQALRAKN